MTESTRVPIFSRMAADSEAFGPAFGDDLPSFRRWMAVLDAAQGRTLDDEAAKLFAEVAGDRPAPIAPVRELWAVVGRRGGKSRVGGLVAASLAVADYGSILAPGQRGELSIISTNKSTCREVFGFARGALETSPRFSKMVENVVEGHLTIQLSNNIDIRARPANWRTVRGPTCVGAVLDEACFWHLESEGSLNPAEEVIRALWPSMASVPSAMMVTISSPYSKAGPVYEAWKTSFGVDDPRALVIQAPTRMMNETIPEDFIEAELERDEVGASSEYLAQWRSDIAQLFAVERVEACIDEGVEQRPPVDGISYQCFVDVSGGSSDSTAATIGHMDGETVVVDQVLEWRSPHNPSEVLDELVETLKPYRVFEVESDRYAGQWPVEQFRQRGITCRQAAQPKSDLYLGLLPLINSGQVRLVDNPRLVRQLAGLERRVLRLQKSVRPKSPGNPRHSGQTARILRKYCKNKD